MMKKFWLSILCLGLVSALLLAGCNSASGDDGNSEAGGGGTPRTLVMATEAGYKPFEYYEGTKIIGVDVDIANEIAKELGAELVIEDMVFDAIIPSVSTGKADFGAAGLTVTEERALSVDFTITYALSPQVIIVAEGSDIEGPDDLDGRTVGVQLGTLADLVLSDDEDYPGITDIERYNKYFEAANDLLAGRIDAIVMDGLPAQELAKMDEALTVLDEDLFTDELAICVAKGNDELLEAINTVLERLIAEGKIEQYILSHSAD